MFIPISGIRTCTRTETVIDRTDGAAIGDMTSGGGLAAAFDGVTSQASAACATMPGGQAYAYIGKDWGVGITHDVSKAVIYPSNNNGFHPGSPNITLILQGSNNGSDWDNLGSIGSFADTTTEQTITATSFGNYRYHRIYIQSSITNALYCAECQFYERLCV